MKRLIGLLFILITITSYLSSQNTGKEPISVKASLDSAYIEMGRITTLHVEVIGNLSETGGLFLPDTLWRDVEIANPGEPLLTDLGNGRKELRQDIILQSFDSGLYTLPPVIYIEEGKMIESNRPALKVVPVDIDSLQTIHDYYDAQNPRYHFFDFLPDWMTDYGLWIILALLIIAAALYIYFKWIKEGKLPLIPAKKPIPPYELAMERLETLRSENLCERGEEKEFYTRLIDILRSYLDTRFGINAMEMTSGQIIKALKNNEKTRLPEKYISKVLETADFVKFAKVRPMPEDNNASFKAAVQFVEDTKPEEEPKETSQKEEAEEKKNE